MEQARGNGCLDDTGRFPPIQWSPDDTHVYGAKAYAESWLRQHPEPPANHPRFRYITVRRAIMNRIHGNLRNANWRAYPSEISYSTVAATLQREQHLCHCDTAGLLAALDGAWEEVREYFTLNFTKHDLVS